VRFAFNTQVRSIAPGTQPEVLIQASPEIGVPPASHALRRERHDAVVVCAATGTRDLLEPLKLKLPLIALRSVSVTAPLRVRESEVDTAPSAAIVDVSRKVSITRLGREVRATRLPFIGSGSKAETQRTVNQLFSAIDTWFPSAATLRQARPWSGAIAALPDGWPAIGPSGIDGVWLNVGHGQAGWSLACGQARLLADILIGEADVAHAAAVSVRRWASNPRDRR
jgi:D-amino-acid dehydrogenase